MKENFPPRPTPPFSFLMGMVMIFVMGALFGSSLTRGYNVVVPCLGLLIGVGWMFICWNDAWTFQTKTYLKYRIGELDKDVKALRGVVFDYLQANPPVPGIRGERSLDQHGERGVEEKGN